MRQPGRSRSRQRGESAPAEEAPAYDSARPIGELIPQILKRFGLEDRLWEQALVSEWDALVGKQVARHSRPGRLDHRTLYVFVSNSTWLNELARYGKKQMIENLQKRFGADKIRDVRLQIDPDQQ